MVAKPGDQRVNFNSGELAVGLWDRTDVKTWYAGGSLMDGFEPVPQGGFQQLPRSRFRALIGRSMATSGAPIAVTAAAGVTTSGIKATIDLGSSQQVDAFDLDGFLGSQALPLSLTADLSNSAGAVGTPFVGTMDIATTARSRRFAMPPGSPASGRYIHLSLAVAPPSSTNLTFGTLQLLTETSVLDVRLKPFGAQHSSAYVVALTPSNADIFKSGIFVGSAATPYVADQLPIVNTTQRFDTMLLWHPDVFPRRLLRVNGDNDWRTDQAPFTNIPNVDYGGVYTNGVAEVWNLYLAYVSGGAPGNKFALNIDGYETAEFSIFFVGSAIDLAATAADCLRVVQDVPEMQGGTITSVGTLDPASGSRNMIITLTFDGTIKGDNFSITGHPTAVAQNTLTTSRSVRGVKPGEPVMSALRGYPGCGVFYQDRLFMGGFKALGSSYLASQTAEYFQLNTQLLGASAPILDNLDTDGSETIYAFVRSKNLVLFTGEGNRYLNSRAVSNTDPRNWVYSTNDGIAQGTTPVESESSLLFISPERTQIMAATYSDNSQGYDAAPISLLASHLVTDATEMCLQHSQTETDSQRLFIVNSNGKMNVAILIRNQDVNAFVRWSTDGLVRSACVDGANVVSIAVERTIGGVQRLCYETWEPDLLFDQAITVSQASSTIVTGLGALEGATVWGMFDGWIDGPFTVTGGQITCPWPVVNATVGRWTPPIWEDLPLSKIVNGNNVAMDRPRRIHTVRCQVIDTTSIAISANGQPPKNRPLARYGDPTDTPTPPYTGPIDVVALKGWTRNGIATITQTKPGKLTLRSYVREAKT